jgi:hypothetical protein
MSKCQQARCALAPARHPSAHRGMAIAGKRSSRVTAKAAAKSANATVAKCLQRESMHAGMGGRREAAAAAAAAAVRRLAYRPCRGHVMSECIHMAAVRWLSEEALLQGGGHHQWEQEHRATTAS